jgi:hypothetical protein
VTKGWLPVVNGEPVRASVGGRRWRMGSYYR